MNDVMMHVHSDFQSPRPASAELRKPSILLLLTKPHHPRAIMLEIGNGMMLRNTECLEIVMMFGNTDGDA